MVSAGGLQGDPGGAEVGESGEEGFTAFRGVGEAEAGGFGELETRARSRWGLLTSMPAKVMVVLLLVT